MGNVTAKSLPQNHDHETIVLPYLWLLKKLTGIHPEIKMDMLIRINVSGSMMIARE